MLTLLSVFLKSIHQFYTTYKTSNITVHKLKASPSNRVNMPEFPNYLQWGGNHQQEKIIFHRAKWWTEHKDWIHPSCSPPHTQYRSLTITLRHTTFSRTPLNGWSAWQTWQHTTQPTDQHPCCGKIQTHRSNWAALELAATGRVYLVFLVNPTQGTHSYSEKMYYLWSRFRYCSFLKSPHQSNIQFLFFLKKSVLCNDNP
jgi:hypothetical protein